MKLRNSAVGVLNRSCHANVWEVPVNTMELNFLKMQVMSCRRCFPKNFQKKYQDRFPIVKLLLQGSAGKMEIAKITKK